MDPSFPPPQHTNQHQRQIQYHESPFQRNSSLPGLPSPGAADPEAAAFHPHLQSFRQLPYGATGQGPPVATGPNVTVGSFEVGDVEPAVSHSSQPLPQLRSHQGEQILSRKRPADQVRQQRRPRRSEQPLPPPSQGAGGPIDASGHEQCSIHDHRASVDDAGGQLRPRLQVNDGQPPSHGCELDDPQANGEAAVIFVVDPPNLSEWRQKLFDLHEMVTLDQEEFETYFPHVDNVYSHRSTQRYKRKPFVTHYWDCRMKGRPPGTPKSDDPGKKKRKRQSRGRDLCDVKIKITEYFAGAAVDAADLGGGADSSLTSSSSSSAAVREALATGVTTRRLWTIQRVNGNGTNGVGDGKLAAHKHDLERSDEIKKNSVQRWVAAKEKGVKKVRKPSEWKSTGNAAVTARKHAKESDLKLYASCFCPFSQRVWIALEAKGLPYQYCETNPFRKPKPTHLLEANPRGLVPAIRQGEWACGESAVILEYLEDLNSTVPLHPTDPRLKANCRLWIDFINTKFVPSFYAVLNETSDPETLGKASDTLQRDIVSLVQAADEEGPYFLGDQMCLVDIHFAPFALRLSRMLQPFRGWSSAVPGSRWQKWIDAMEGNSHVQNTLSSNALYMETMELLIQGSQSQAE